MFQLNRKRLKILDFLRCSPPGKIATTTGFCVIYQPAREATVQSQLIPTTAASTFRQYKLIFIASLSSDIIMFVLKARASQKNSPFLAASLPSYTFPSTRLTSSKASHCPLLFCQSCPGSRVIPLSCVINAGATLSNQNALTMGTLLGDRLVTTHFAEI
jgi:hypothetical protein